ncbi:hypothetical protein [Geothrix sp. 21YS21S-4]|uniref:hypothetical protein n=1 Tax=Geothrix sp. 21YS21S-4 TaxID=3068889 RepID=UPI0027B92D9E|nr:hypothetical protein [Geothrix sp. 21YS21S-4]
MRALATSLLQRVGSLGARLIPTPLCAPLRVATRELRRTLHLAFGLAAAHDRTVILEPHREASAGRISVRLPQGVRWGRPEQVPLPPSLADSGWWSGHPHPITVMPHGRAAANVWFLHHGREALCLRLDLAGSLELLRYRPLWRTWTRC